MKKLIIIAALIAATFASCKKSHSVVVTPTKKPSKDTVKVTIVDPVDTNQNSNQTY
jgi:hypothetical protein